MRRAGGKEGVHLTNKGELEGQRREGNSRAKKNK